MVESINSPSFEQAVGAQGSDIEFLSELLNNTVVQSLIRVCMVHSSLWKMRGHFPVGQRSGGFIGNSWKIRVPTMNGLALISLFLKSQKCDHFPILYGGHTERKLAIINLAIC